MNAFLDNALVGLLLLAALSYAIVALGPRTLKRRVLAARARLFHRPPPAAAAGGCGGCGGCAADAPGAITASAAETTVPLRNIGRRSG